MAAMASPSESIVERRRHLAVGLEPLPDAEAQLARHQRFRRRRAQIVAVALEAFAHFDHVAMAFGREQRNLRALALQQRVGRDRRAVNQPVCRLRASLRALPSAFAPVLPVRP